MKSSRNNLGEQELQEALRRRAAGMRRFIESKIPRNLRGWMSCDDILQEVWVNAFRGESAFRPSRGDSLDRWLTGIINRVFADRLRRGLADKRGARRQARTGKDTPILCVVDLFEELASPGRSPSGQVASSEASDAIHEALDTLHGSYRQALWLHYVEGRSRKDIAVVMDRSEAAVNTLIFKGLRQLKERLGSSGRFFSDSASSVDLIPTC